MRQLSTLLLTLTLLIGATAAFAGQPEVPGATASPAVPLEAQLTPVSPDDPADALEGSSSLPEPIPASHNSLFCWQQAFECQSNCNGERTCQEECGQELIDCLQHEG